MKIFTKKKSAKIVKRKTIDEIIKYTPNNRNYHRLKKLGLEEIYPKYNLLYYGIKRGYLWDDNNKYLYSKEVGQKILVEIWKLIKEGWDIEPSLDIQIIVNPTTGEFSIPTYIVDSFLTPEQKANIEINYNLSKEEKKILDKILEEKDNLDLVIKLVPKYIFQENMLQYALNHRSSQIEKEIKVLLSESHKLLSPYPITEDTFRTKSRTFIVTVIQLGIAYYTASTLPSILGTKSSNKALQYFLECQQKSVKRKQADALCKYILEINKDNISKVIKNKPLLRDILLMEKKTYASYYLKRKLLSDILNYKSTRLPILNIIDVLYNPRLIQGESERVIKDMLKMKWTSESKLLKTMKKYPKETLFKLPQILLQAIKSKKDEPIYEFISFLYESPKLLNGILDKRLIVEGIWNLEYALNVYPGMRDIEPYIKSEILDAISVCRFNIKSDELPIDSEKEKDNSEDFIKFPYKTIFFPNNELTRINRFIRPDLFSIVKFKNDIDINFIQVDLEKGNAEMSFETFDKTLKKGTIYRPEGALAQPYKLGKNPNEDWILCWANTIPAFILPEFIKSTNTLKIKVTSTDNIKRLFFNSVRDSTDVFNEGEYIFLLFAYHSPTKTLFRNFNLGSTVLSIYIEPKLVKSWNPASFFRYMEPFLTYPILQHE